MPAWTRHRTVAADRAGATVLRGSTGTRPGRRLNAGIRQSARDDWGMHLLLDIWFAPGGPWADRLQALLLAIPGVRRVRVFPDVGQAEVELGDPSSALPEAVVLY